MLNSNYDPNLRTLTLPPRLKEGERIQFRCPQCKKLYVTQKGRVTGKEAHFECITCHTEFYFKAEWIQGNHVETLKEGQESPGKDFRSGFGSGFGSGSADTSKNELPCPKCGTPNPNGARECLKCRVLIERVRNLPADPSFRATPTLMRLWEEVVNHYTVPDWHDQFIRACQRGNALKLAEFQYRSLAANLGSDSVTKLRLEQIEAMILTEIDKKRPKTFDFLMKMPRNQLVALGLPFVIGSICILIGLLKSSSRNMIGFGVAVICLGGGIEYLLKDMIFPPQDKK